MGRSLESVRMGVKEISEKWLKASRALKKENQIYGQIIADMGGWLLLPSLHSHPSLLSHHPNPMIYK